jgi:6,7-dimethyl-8-ribityllumazine synthase
MLKALKNKRNRPSGGRFAIVASKYNSRYVEGMLRAAQAELKRARVETIEVFRVPGAYEVPVVATALAGRSSPRFSAIICLGVILRGATAHADHIGRAVSDALMRIQLQHEIPVIHEVLLLENEEQARARCLAKKFNRGTEAAQTALEMAQVMQKLNLSSY